MAFPFSGLLMGLLAVFVGAFLIVATSILLIVYVMMALGVARFVIAGCRRAFGRDQPTGFGNTNKLTRPLGDRGQEASGPGLWDRWLDDGW